MTAPNPPNNHLNKTGHEEEALSKGRGTPAFRQVHNGNGTQNHVHSLGMVAGEVDGSGDYQAPVRDNGVVVASCSDINPPLQAAPPMATATCFNREHEFVIHIELPHYHDQRNHGGRLDSRPEWERIHLHTRGSMADSHDNGAEETASGTRITSASDQASHGDNIALQAPLPAVTADHIVRRPEFVIDIGSPEHNTQVTRHDGHPEWKRWLKIAVKGLIGISASSVSGISIGLWSDNPYYGVGAAGSAATVSGFILKGW
ncbi:hypothetical protein BJX96DRAFT_147320 [Aspergillus floccosus]